MVHMKKLSKRLLEVILELMHVQDYMIFIMEKIKMWDVYKKESYDIWTNKVCSLKIEYLQDYCKVFVNYKGYNVIMPMGIWGFEEEMQERNIQYEVDGEKDNILFLVINSYVMLVWCIIDK